MIAYLFIALAAIFNAFMDTVENKVSYEASIFKSLDINFWRKDISWQYAKKIFGFHPDGWHFAKSLMIICIALSIVLFKPHYQLLVHFVSMGVVWNGSFSLFYWLFKSKTWK